MKIRFDRESDALYVRFSDGEVAETEEVRPGVMLDYDSAGRIVALEILKASKTVADTDLQQLAG